MPNNNGMRELGRLGQRRWGGAFYEEFLKELRGRRGMETYREMADNDDIIGAIIYAIELLIRQVDWDVQPGGPSEADQAAADFVRECIHNGSEEYRSWQGFFRVRVPVSPDGAMDAGEMSRMLKSVGLDDLLTTPTAEAEKTLIKSRLVWQNAPSRVQELQGLTGQALEDKLDDILRDIGIADKRIAGVELRKIAEGYATYYDPEMAAAMKKAGADYVWSGVRRPQGIVQVIKSGGMKSTNQRTFTGVRITGASPESDMGTGGADSVFTRLGIRGNGERFNSSFSGGPYRIIIDPAELGRTDWYAYTFDNFGTTETSEMLGRMPGTDFAAAMKKRYRNSNEIMFRHAIPTESFTGIVCETAADRAALIKEFKAEGITEINGIPIATFIKVGSSL